MNILNMVYTLRFFPSKCSSYHNSNVFGSCIIHILYTGCAKIKRNNSVFKYFEHGIYSPFFPSKCSLFHNSNYLVPVLFTFYIRNVLRLKAIIPTSKILNMVHSLRLFPLQNAVCFIILTYFVPVLFTFYIPDVLKLKDIIPASKSLNMVHTVRFFPLQNAVCFIILTYLVPVLFTFYIENLLKLKEIIPASNILNMVHFLRFILSKMQFVS